MLLAGKREKNFFGFSLVVIILLLPLFQCGDSSGKVPTNKPSTAPHAVMSGTTDFPNDGKTVVTFIELGSENCVPCRMMQPVMEKVKKRHGDQVRVVFYDILKSDQRKYARKYGIRVIPTQVFLDKNGREYARHEGFFPYEELVKALEARGVK